MLDRVIPSYAPSLTALADTLGAHTPQPPHRAALVVGVGTVEGQLVLPNAHAHAHAEAEAVARLIPGSTVLLDEAASVDAIECGLHEHAIAHFACHGAAISSDAPTNLGGLVHTALTAGGTQPVDTTSAATALTHALRRIRDAYPAVPTRWALHVHVGL